MMDQIAAHEDECVWVGGRAGQGTQVTDGVSWGVEKIKRTIAEKVMGWEIRDYRVERFDLDYFSSSEITLPHRRVILCGISR